MTLDKANVPAANINHTNIKHTTKANLPVVCLVGNAAAIVAKRPSDVRQRNADKRTIDENGSAANGDGSIQHRRNAFEDCTHASNM